MEVDALSVSLRALSFLALFQAAGVAIFLALFGRNLTTCGPALRRLGIFSAVVAMVLVLAHYALEAARMTGELAGALDSTYQSMVMHSTLSVALACRVVGLALILTALVTRSGASKVLGVIGAVLAVAAFTFVGHTTTHAPRWLLSALLLVHVLVVAFWFGALLPLFRVSAREPARVAGRVLSSFSSRATWLVPVLFFAGLFLTVGILPNVAALSTTYGELLLLKVGGFAVLMLLATLNKWTYAPALERGDASAGRAFRRTVLAEYAIIAAILSVTAALTTFYSPDG